MNGTFSLNNRLVVEAYLSDRALKAKETNGFAMIQQKVEVKGLKLLMDARLTQMGNVQIDGVSAPAIVPKGSTVYIREELLHTQAWAQKILESPAVEGKFIIVDVNNVEFVVLS